MPQQPDAWPPPDSDVEGATTRRERMDGWTYLAIGLTLGVYTLLVASLANDVLSEPDSLSAELGLVFASSGFALFGAFACSLYLAVHKAPPAAYVLLVAALVTVTAGIIVVTVSLVSESLGSPVGVVALGPAFGFGMALLGMATGYGLGVLVRRLRDR